MKKTVLIPAILLLAFVAVTSNVQAQKDKDVKIEQRAAVDDDNDFAPFHNNIPGLTDKQKEDIDKLMIDHQKKARLLHATMQEKRAHLNTLRLADNPDMQQINRTIDDIAALHADLMKERENHHQAVRSKLNDEQKAWFDSRPMHRRGNDGPGFCNGKGPGHDCPGCDGMGPRHGKHAQGEDRGYRMRMNQD